MKFCADHWSKLRAAIAARGLSDMIAKDGTEAAQQLVDGRPDPLMAAHNAIVRNLVDAYGIGVMVIEGCPLCGAKQACFDNPCPGGCGREDCSPENNAAKFETWIDRAADDQLERIGARRGTT